MLPFLITLNWNLYLLLDINQNTDSWYLHTERNKRYKYRGKRKANIVKITFHFTLLRVCRVCVSSDRKKNYTSQPLIKRKHISEFICGGTDLYLFWQLAMKSVVLSSSDQAEVNVRRQKKKKKWSLQLISFVCCLMSCWATACCRSYEEHKGGKQIISTYFCYLLAAEFRVR